MPTNEAADPAYGMTVHLPGVSVEQARAVAAAALQDEGFGILTEIDVATTLQKKLDVSFPPYLILGACNPGLAHRALLAEAGVGLLLPCNVVVREEPGGAVVSIAKPSAMFSIIDKPELLPIVNEAESKLARVLEKIGARR